MAINRGSWSVVIGMACATQGRSVGHVFDAPCVKRLFSIAASVELLTPHGGRCWTWRRMPGISCLALAEIRRKCRGRDRRRLRLGAVQAVASGLPGRSQVFERRRVARHHSPRRDRELPIDEGVCGRLPNRLHVERPHEPRQQIQHDRDPSDTRLHSERACVPRRTRERW
jgi:hypothetical protein